MISFDTSHCQICLGSFTKNGKDYECQFCQTKFIVFETSLHPLQNIQAQPLKNVYMVNFKKPPLMKKKNNLIKTIEDNFGENSYTENYYTNFNGKLISNQKLLILSKRNSDIIQYVKANKNFMPLTIKKSKIPNAGLGIFAKMDLEQNTYLSSYVGEIVPNINALSINAVVDLFKINNQMFVISPFRKLNEARYYNSQKQSEHNNMSVLLCLRRKQNHFELQFVMWTNKKVKKDEQLCWYYGQNFNYEI